MEDPYMCAVDIGRIDEILATRMPHNTKSFRWEHDQYTKAWRMLNNVLSGKDVPFDGAVEYLQRVKRGE